MSRIHYFNPGHETAVLLGTQNYTAPTNVRKMQKDLALLPVWYAEEDDFVYLEDSKATPSVFRPFAQRPTPGSYTCNKSDADEKRSLPLSYGRSPVGTFPA